MTKSNKNKKLNKDLERGLGKGLASLLGDRAALASLQDSVPDGATAAPGAGIPAGGGIPVEGGAPAGAGVAKGGVAPAEAGAISVAITAIIPSPWQPRRRFDDASLADLVASIKQHGVIQPLLVREADEPGTYEMIAGERRWRAAQQAGLHDLPVLVRDADDRMAAEIALIENIQRHDLTIIEEASGYRRLMDEFGYTQMQLSAIVGKSRSHLANVMRLLTLPPEVLAMIAEGRVSGGQMRPLIGRADAASLARKVASQGMSARQVEAMVARIGRPSAPPRVDENIAALERKLMAQHGLDIAIKFNHNKGSGAITITCKTLEQFDAMIALLER